MTYYYPFKTPTPIRRRGKKALLWLAFRRRYLAGKQTNEGLFRCDRCGRLTREIELHHLFKRSIAPHLVFDDRNIQMLCYACHGDVHGERGLRDRRPDRDGLTNRD